MGEKKNSSYQHHIRQGTPTESGIDLSTDSLEIQSDNTKGHFKEALDKVQRTLRTLENMCTRQGCSIVEQIRCEPLEKALNILVSLARKGFTVLELECHVKSKSQTNKSEGTIRLWQFTCEYCLNQFLDHEKEGCLKEQIERELQALHKIYFTPRDLHCLQNILKNVFF